MEFTFSLCFAIGELLFGLVEDWSFNFQIYEIKVDILFL